MKKLLYTLLAVSIIFSACKKEGCTDSLASNYNPDANEDDGSCDFSINTNGNSTVWQKSYNGASFTSIKKTTDGGYIITGSKDYKVFLLKINENGSEVWSNTIGDGNSNLQCVGEDVNLTSNGGYVVAKSITTGVDYNQQVVCQLLITNSSGELIENLKAPSKGNYIIPRSVHESTPGQYVVTGSAFTTSTIITIPSSTYRNVFIYSNFPGGFYMFDYSVADNGGYSTQTLDGGVMIVSTQQYSIPRIVKAGADYFTNTFNGSYERSGFLDVQSTDDGGYIMSGHTSTNYDGTSNWKADIFLVKADGNGNELWSKSYNNSSSAGKWEIGDCVQQTSDGGYIISGRTGIESNYNTYKYLIKTDNNGNETWRQTIGSSVDFDVKAYVVQTSDGGYIIAGSDGKIVKIAI